MHCLTRLPFLWSLVALLLATHPAVGQTLSILKDGEDGVRIEIAAPPETRYVLQASEDFRQWVDLHDELWNQSSHRILTTGVTSRYFRLTQWTEPAENITVVILGDSTVADFASNLNYFHGWGQGMYGYFKPSARVINLAMPGYSSKVFLNSAERTQTIALKPDYVLVQFGLTDEFGSLPSQTTTLPEFADNLRLIVAMVRDFGGTPILLTPPVRKLFDAAGKIIPIYQDRFAVIKAVAAELQTQLIDLERLTMDHANTLGPIESDFMWWPDNYLHYTLEGAEILSGMVVSQLPAAVAPHLKLLTEAPVKP